VNATTAPPEVLIDLTLDVAPIPKGRPRVNTQTGRAYTPAATRAYEQRIGWLLRQARVPCAGSGELGVTAVFHLTDGQRADVDNLAKALLDGANGVAYRDDAQVTCLDARIVRGDGPPRIRLTVYRLTPGETE